MQSIGIIIIGNSNDIKFNDNNIIWQYNISILKIKLLLWSYNSSEFRNYYICWKQKLNQVLAMATHYIPRITLHNTLHYSTLIFCAVSCVLLVVLLWIEIKFSPYVSNDVLLICIHSSWLAYVLCIRVWYHFYLFSYQRRSSMLCASRMVVWSWTKDEEK